MSDKAGFAKGRINELLDAVIERENLSKQSLADLGFVRFYVKELEPCTDCDQNETPTQSQNES